MTERGSRPTMPKITEPIDVASILSKGIIVTGAHYSMTSAVGEIVADAPGIHLVHEPFNPAPTLGYETIGTEHWYQHIEQADFDDAAADLARIASGIAPRGDLRRRLAALRTGRDLLRIGKITRDRTTRRFTEGLPLFKDPFMLFAAADLQRTFGTSVALCVRHPCAFVESVDRRSNGFDLAELASQPDLVARLDSADADLLDRAMTSSPSSVERSAILWRIVYRFAAEHLVEHPRTVVVHQEDFVTDPATFVKTLYGSLDLQPRTTFAELAARYSSTPNTARQRRSNVHRDGRHAATKWRQRLSSQEQQTVVGTVRDVAATFGYEL